MSEHTLQKRAAAGPPAARAAAPATPTAVGAASKLATKAQGLTAAPRVQALEGLKETLKRPNRTGLPDRLKAGMEAISGVALDHVRVRFNSAAPAAIDADAFAQGRDIHIGPGQERHLPHEAWHAVQQAQGRVRPTTTLHTGAPLNDDRGLEREADIMGARAAAAGRAGPGPLAAAPAPAGGGVVQGMLRAGLSRLSAGRPAAAAGWRGLSSGSGGGGDDWRRQQRALEEMKKAQREAQARAQLEAQARARRLALLTRPLIPRASAVTHGPDFGYLTSGAGSLHRATVNNESILRSIDQTGFTSPAVRAGQQPPATPPTPEEITAYSGVDGQAPQFRTSRLIGLNTNVRHTVDVASATSGFGNLQGMAQAPAPTQGAATFGRLDEVRTGGLSLSSVEAAFQQTGERNRYPVAGEFVSPSTIPPSALGHTSAFPLGRRFAGAPLGQPGQVHPDYLANLGRATGATDDASQAFDIRTRRHPHPDDPSRHVEIDEFIAPEPAAAPLPAAAALAAAARGVAHRPRRADAGPRSSISATARAHAKAPEEVQDPREKMTASG